MKNHLIFVLNKIFICITSLILISGCIRISNYALEDVEKQRLKFLNGDAKALNLLSEIYKDNNQSYDVRLAALRALSESRHPLIINDIQSSVRNASLIELDLMKEAIEMLITYDQINSVDSLIESLNATEEKTIEIRTYILNALGKHQTKEEIQLILKLYDFSKRSNAQMNGLLATKLGEIGDESVIPILMEIAKNTNLTADIRNRAVEMLSKKQAPELVDFFVELLGDPVTRDKVNEYAFDVMGDMPEERMLLTLLEAYQIGRHKYFALLNTVMTNLDNYQNPEIKSVYFEIARTNAFPANIRLKAFQGLTRYSDPEVIAGVVDLLNDPINYIYYNEIIGMLHKYEVYNLYEEKLRIAAYNAMKKDRGYIGFINLND